MARTTATNFTGPLQFPYATAGTDIFKKEDVQILAQATDQHDHSPGKGLVLSAGSIPAGSITSAMIADGTIVAGDIANGAITSAKILDGTIATADLADNAVTNQKLGTDTARLNLLTNGGFEIWQRGNGPFTVNGVFCADRWQVGIAASDTFSVNRNTSVVSSVGSTASAGCTFTLSGGAGTSSVNQVLRLSDNPQLKGCTVTFSLAVNTGTANAVRLAVASDGAATVYSAFHSGSGSFSTLSVTATVSSSATYVMLQALFAASCTAYLDNAMLVVGSVPADYAPLHPADDLARCSRYFEYLTFGVGTEYVTVAQASSATAAYGPLRFRTQKAVTPTVSASSATHFQCYSAALASILCTAISASATTPYDVGLSFSVASGLVAGNATLVQAISALQSIVAEANP